MKIVAMLGLYILVALMLYTLYLGYRLATNKVKPLNQTERDGVAWDMRTALVVIAIALGFLSGCTTTRLELEHVSHPFAGPPFGPMTEEDSLTQINYCKGTNRNRWYVENCLGMKIGDTGFYGPRLTYTGRIGMQWGGR